MNPIDYEQTPDGRLAAWVFKSSDRILLRRAGEVVHHDFGGEAFERFDGGDQVFWDFLVAGQRITLHLVEGRGIAVEASDHAPRSANLVRQIAERLAAFGPNPVAP